MSARGGKKERSTRSRIWRSLLGLVLVVIGVVGATGLLLARPAFDTTPPLFGVSFSTPHAEGIGLDWKETYAAILDDLGVRHLRLSAYWDQVEPQDDQWDFADLDHQMDEAHKRGASVLLAVGRKLPRWPECHEPAWAEELPNDEQEEEILELVEMVVTRYREHPALVMWQLENEPLLNFGHCPPENRPLLAKEEALLRSLDPNHPIVITDSGELNSWVPAAAYGDILGTTMYRTVFSGRTQKLFHYDYIFPSWLYRAKARVVGLVRGNPVLISELQGEPWGAQPFTQMSRAERHASLSPKRLNDLGNFAARTQLPLAYWWGVEYWYWEKEVHDEPVFWETARRFFR